MTIALTLLAVALLTGYAARKRTAWAERGITSRVPYPLLFTVQAAVALGTAAFVGHRFGPAPALAAASAAWLGVLVTATDVSCLLIPREMPHPVAVIGLLAAGWHLGTSGIEGWLSFGCCLVGLVGGFWLLRAGTRKGLGLSDIRLMWAFTATLSWWVGTTHMLYGLIVAWAIQVAAHLLARPLGFGRLAPIPNSDRSTAGDQTQPHPTVKMRRELPFGPALVIGLLLAAGYVATTGLGACADWSATGVCR